jgi:hypothetical protein
MFQTLLNSDLQIKILSINPKKNIANIELLLFVDKQQSASSFVQFFLYDFDTQSEERVNDLNYWISDYSTVTSNLSNKNVNINFYKKIYFFIDTSNVQRATFNSNRWFRKVKLIAKVFKENESGNYALDNNNGSWSSGELTLISQEVFVPALKGIEVNTFNEGGHEVFNIKAKYDYALENDFNYSNPFLYYKIKVNSPINGRLIASEGTLQENGTKDLNTSIGVIEYSFYDLYINMDSIITIDITNQKGEVLKTKSVVFKPFKPSVRTYIKWNNKVVEVKSVFVNDFNETSTNNNDDLDIYKNTTGLSYKPNP